MSDSPEVASDEKATLHAMTSFDVHLNIKMDNKEMERVGSPIDWKWHRVIDKGIGGSAFTDVKVRSVTVTSTSFENEAGETIQETTYDVVDKPLSGLSASVDKILGYAQDYITDDRYKHGAAANSEEEQRAELSELIEVRDFARSQLNNQNIGDSSIDNFVKGLSEKTTVFSTNLETGVETVLGV